ncbi:hypothetical protein GGI07_005003 [Coemansia sp. Benny D115]|nr:hypothetical protein GGI07_005003 [Coemansia sp. Benny D115]
MARRESMGAANIRRANNPQGTPQPLLRAGAEYGSQRARPATARSRLSHGGALGPGAEPISAGAGAGPYMHAGTLGDSCVSLLSMVGTRDEPPAVKNARSFRALPGEHVAGAGAVGGAGGGDSIRPRSRTQSSEPGVVTVFSGVQLPPRLDADLDALNRLPAFRPLVLAPNNGRLAGLFHSGPRYVEPTAEQLRLDEAELAGLSFAFRDHVAARAQTVCERQTAVVTSARRVGMRAADSGTRAAQALVAARQVHDGATVLRALQRQAERAYELVQDIMRDIERLDALERATAGPPTSAQSQLQSQSPAPTAFPAIERMRAQRRQRQRLPARRTPVFAARSSSLAADCFSAPASPADARVSFDGSTLHAPEPASMALVAARGSVRRPASVVAHSHGTHSRSEVSLSRAQAVWSPQVAETAAFAEAHTSPMPAPALSPASVRALHLRMPRGLSMRSSSAASSPSESLLSPTPAGSPQFPAEATRMLRQVIHEQPPVSAPELPSSAARMSTWSASSGRTLADDPRLPKPPSAALSSLAASAAVVNGRSRRPAYQRALPDLGLSMRSVLERRVRSFSASESNALLRQAARPHSSMGFHAPIGVSDAHRAGGRRDKHSVASLGLDALSLADPDADIDDDAASVSSQATERLPPTPPNSASYAAVAKRRAQTIANPH